MRRKRTFAPLFQRRYAAAKNPCPKCGAKENEPCVRPSGQARLSIHQERLRLYDAADLVKPD